MAFWALNYPCFFSFTYYNEHNLQKEGVAMDRTNSLDMTEGSITKKLLLFALPILASYLIQHFYSIADSVVVGNFAPDGTTAQAAIGATNPAINMLQNLIVGISLGANVVCSKLRGAKDQDALRKGMHSTVLLSAICGIALMVLGILLSETILTATNTPKEVLPAAVDYMQIRFWGMPAAIVMNFCIAIMRSNGDTKRPMYILTASGLVNVALNLVLVIYWRMGADGVALATIVSQYLSTIALLYILFKPTDEYCLRVQELAINKQLLWNIIAIGVPCGISSILHSGTNLILQSSVNTFGKVVIAGNASATSINCIVYLVNDAFAAACLSFAGQCFGAKAYKRLDKLALTAMVYNGGIVLAIAGLITLFTRPMLGLFNPDPMVVDAGVFKLLLLCWTTCFFGVSEIFVACMRGMGKSLAPMIVNIICICGIRLLWALVIFPYFPHDPRYLYLCFPISWVIAMAAQLLNFVICRRQLR